MSENLDRALDALDAGIELAAAPASDDSYEPYGTDDPTLCWRCADEPATLDVGLCAGCHEILTADEWTPPNVDDERSGDAAALRQFALASDEFAASVRRMAQALTTALAPIHASIARLTQDYAEVEQMKANLRARGLSTASIQQLWDLAVDEGRYTPRSTMDAFRRHHDTISRQLALAEPALAEPAIATDHRGVRHALTLRPLITMIDP